MIGTIGDLEREIEQFQNNIAASGELVALLREMLNSVKMQEQVFTDKMTMLLAKIDSTPERIVADNLKMLESTKRELDQLLSEKNYAFASTQERFVSALGETKTELKECAEQLEKKYANFINVLERLRITDVYEQNIQIRNELNKRTRLLMILSGVSVILGIVGIIL